jgi:ribosome biogenesis GTPase
LLARVFASYRGLWLVATSNQYRLVPARGRLTETPVTGDYVELDDGEAIAAVHERRGTIVRRAAGTATGAQVLAANVDLALVTEPLPEPNPRRLERYVALAGEVASALVLTKADLADDGYETAARLARMLGVPDGVAVSASTGEGFGTLRSWLAPGVTAVLLGASGTGKSTLANALVGEDRQATGAVRTADARGRHTTVTRELLALPGGAFLVDTPGLREAGVWDGAHFDDVDTLAAGCRFADCAHDSEPGCAVRDAVGADRLTAWRKLQREQAWVDDRRAAARAREARGRAIAKSGRGESNPHLWLGKPTS